MNGRFEGKIFHLDENDALSESREEPFALEEDLESLIAEHPDLLPGDQIDPESPRRWLFVDRQVDIPGDSASWALDLLFVDQDGIPTFAELKKGSNPELRRKVVGQMLDYAANAPIFWPPGALRSLYETRSGASGETENADLLRAIGEAADVDDFWTRVDANLKERNLRPLFVTDRMVPELRRVVEFLNQSMERVEVLAVELRQFKGPHGATLVPLVYGHSLAATEKKSSGGRLRAQPWTEIEFLDQLEKEKGTEYRRIAGSIIEWARQLNARFAWGRGLKMGSFFPVFDIETANVYPICLWTYGKVELQFEYLKHHPPFTERKEREALRVRLKELLKIEIPADRVDWRPSFDMSVLTAPATLSAFLDLMAAVPSRVREAMEP